MPGEGASACSDEVYGGGEDGSGILLCLEGLRVVEGRVGVVTGIIEGTGGEVGVVSFVVSGGVVIGAGTAGEDGKLPLDASAGESQSSIDAS